MQVPAARSSHRVAVPGGPTFDPAPPARYRHTLDFVSRLDRRYFRRHPDHHEYVRPYREGEFYPFMPDDVAEVRVVQLRPGLRQRRPLCPAGAWFCPVATS